MKWLYLDLLIKELHGTIRYEQRLSLAFWQNPSSLRKEPTELFEPIHV
jgi:hypothetical protein